MIFTGSREIGPEAREDISYPLARPSLEYSYAFDICAAEVYHAGGDIAILVSRGFYHSELAARLTFGRHSEISKDESLKIQPRPGSGGLQPDSMATRTIKFIPLYRGLDIAESMAASAPRYKAAIWAAPQAEKAADVISVLANALSPDGVLHVVSPGLLARFSRSQYDTASYSSPAHKALGSITAGRLLKDSGFQINRKLGFHGVNSIFLWYLSLLASKLGREHLADRFHFRMRESYVVTGSLAHLSTLVLYECRRMGSS